MGTDIGNGGVDNGLGLSSRYIVALRGCGTNVVGGVGLSGLGDDGRC